MLLSRNHTLSEELHRLQALMVAHHVEGKLSLHEETDCGDGVKRTELHLKMLFLTLQLQVLRVLEFN